MGACEATSRLGYRRHVCARRRCRFPARARRLAHPQAGPSFAEVAPILAQRSVLCHAGPAAPAGLRLDTLEALLKGSAKGPVVRSGVPADSELVRRIKGISQPGMPMTGPPFPYKNPRPGADVQVRGRLDQAGRVVVERLRPRD